MRTITAITAGTIITAAALAASIMPALASTTPRDCTPGQLHVTSAGPRPAAGQYRAALTVRNTGAECKLAGWPAVTLLNYRQEPLPTHLSRTGRASAVLLPPDGSAGTELSWFSDGTYGAVQSGWLDVDGFFVPFSEQVYGSQLAVTGWRRITPALTWASVLAGCQHSGNCLPVSTATRRDLGISASAPAVLVLGDTSVVYVRNGTGVRAYTS